MWNVFCVNTCFSQKCENIIKYTVYVTNITFKIKYTSILKTNQYISTFTTIFKRDLLESVKKIYFILAQGGDTFLVIFIKPQNVLRYG